MAKPLPLKRLTVGNIDPKTEAVLQRIMEQYQCSRSQAGNLLLKYGTKAIVERLQEKQILNDLFKGAKRQ